MSCNAPCTAVTLDPSVDLGKTVTYRATIVGGANGAKDAASPANALATNKTRTFETGKR